MGRKATPTALKIMRGNPRKENLAARVASEPRPPAASAEAPEILEGDALAMWIRKREQLEGMRVLTDADRETLTRYCLAWELYIGAYREVRASGLSTVIDSGRRVATPEVAALRGFHADLLQIEREFGCTPSSRSGLTVNNGEEKDELDEFLRATS